MSESNGIDYKVCKDCKESKPISEYYLVKSRGVYIPRCNNCRKEKANAYNRSRDESVKQKKRDYAKEYHLKNREKGLEYRKERYLTYDRGEQLEKRRNWYRNNKERHAENREKYESENKGRLRAARRKWENNKLKTDINYNLQKSLRSRVRLSLKGFYRKDKRTEELIGCSIQDFKLHIESQFSEGMTWENWKFNGWHIDHKIPISWFNLENENCRRLAFNYKNMQPLWSNENFIKNNKRYDKIEA